MRLPLRTKVLAIVVVAAVLPLGLTGVWLAAGAERSGEDQLRKRLNDALVRTAQDIGARWVTHRSRLLALAEAAEVQGALDDQQIEGSRQLREGVLPTAIALREGIVDVRLRDAAGTTRWHWDPARPMPGPVVSTSLDVFQRGKHARIGTLDVDLQATAILSMGPGSSAGIGSAITLVDRRTGALLLPLPFDFALVSREKFFWAGEAWLALTRSLDDPSLTIVAYAPLTPYVAPFREAGRRGLAALAMVTAVTCVAVLLLTHRTTRSLGRLAQAARGVSRGDFDRTVEVSGADEVSDLAVAFNTMTENLRRTMAELTRRESVAAVGEFASSLAHEVRNPLTAIRLELQRLEERLPGDAQLREPLDRALRSVMRLDRTVGGALQIARSGQLTLQPVDLQTVLDGVIAEVEPEATERGVTITQQVSETGCTLHADEGALHQLFLNLVLNGLQAVSRGDVVSLEVERAGPHVVVKVSDTGPGIPADAVARVFEPFYSTKSAGTGLGLPIARRIAQAHGGELVVESAAGVIGTMMVVRLPGAAVTSRTGQA